MLPTANLSSRICENSGRVLQSPLPKHAGTQKPATPRCTWRCDTSSTSRTGTTKHVLRCFMHDSFNVFKWSSSFFFFFVPGIWCLVVNWNDVEFGTLRCGTNSNCFQCGSGVLRAPCSCQHGPSRLAKILCVCAWMPLRVCVCQSLFLSTVPVFRALVSSC